MGTASDFVLMGECLHAIQNPQVLRPSLYSLEVGKFFTLLERTGLNSTRRLADTLGGLLIPEDLSGMITSVACKELASRGHPIATRLYEEAGEKAFIESDTDVSSKLVTLSKHLERQLEPHQEALRADTEMCLRARIYRPATVSAWNLCYDLLRWWIYIDSARLSDFNILLGERTQKHRKGVRSIQRYDDFFSESEAFVLELCRDASGSLSTFGDKTFRILQHLLDDRNAFAHANFDDATEAEAKSYVDRVIRVIGNAPLK